MSACIVSRITGDPGRRRFPLFPPHPSSCCVLCSVSVALYQIQIKIQIHIIYIDLVVARFCTLVKQCHQNTSTILLPQFKYRSTTILAQYYYHNTSSKVLLQYYYCFSSAPTMVLRALSMLKNDVQSFQQ